MAIIKLSTSGKAIVVIDDDGNVFTTSKLYFDQMLAGNNKTGFVLMARMPEKAAADRFKKSPLYSHKAKGVIDADKTATDSMSNKGRDAMKQTENYTDDKVIF